MTTASTLTMLSALPLAPLQLAGSAAPSTLSTLQTQIQQTTFLAQFQQYAPPTVTRTTDTHLNWPTSSPDPDSSVTSVPVWPTSDHDPMPQLHAFASVCPLSSRCDPCVTHVEL
eukprot:100360-Rhodomonas_salina.2